ncbi:FKBP-type peptidyl-prolyl cis-trans isomerase [Janthinobacterium sp. HLX7-2]|uniref:FKBP-type peptidyl-prolyl cis-trans isomerase n=1 Tax=Janthinobacterium sp. HLX7-2 TaxID=1259331 RepID=UPI003F21126C
MKSVFQLIATLACAVALTACGAAANTEKLVVLDPNTQVKELTITDVVAGTGTAAAAGDTLLVTYTGSLYDASKPGNKGAQFDATAAGAGFTFTLGIGQVILGWDRGLVGMKEGGTRTLAIPYDLGYGKAGSLPKIPGYSGLLFEVKLVGVTKK